MILNLILLVIGFVFLIKGADIFVDGASSTAQNFKVSKMLIGLTIVAFGTSAPEFAVSISALASGSSDVVLGNVIGSCILNILLIVGVAAVIMPIKIKSNTVTKELPLCLLISVLLAVLLLDSFLGSGENDFSRLDAIVVLLFFLVFLYYLITLARQSRENKHEKNEKPEMKLGKSILFVIIGLVGIVVGSQMVVDNATAIAELIGWSERLISLTIVAFGTSLPELVTTIVASRKGEQDLVVGNIIGSNIFNICIVLGLPVAIFGTISANGFQMLDLIALVVSAAMLLIFAATSHKITKLEGAVMLAAFVAYYAVVMILPAMA